MNFLLYFILIIFILSVIGSITLLIVIKRVEKIANTMVILENNKENITVIINNLRKKIEIFRKIKPMLLLSFPVILIGCFILYIKDIYSINLMILFSIAYPFVWLNIHLNFIFNKKFLYYLEKPKNDKKIIL